MTTRSTKNQTVLTRVRHVRSQTKETYIDGDEHVENNPNLTNHTSTVGEEDYYAGSDHIPDGTPQADTPV